MGVNVGYAWCSTIVELAELFNVYRPTVYCVLERHQARHDGNVPVGNGNAGLADSLPVNTRALPDVGRYDELLTSRQGAAW